jgi:CHAT domain-containing protein/predicted negative regulator of RcsB-dependent stress response
MEVIRADLAAARRLAVAAERIAAPSRNSRSKGLAYRLRGHVYLLEGRSKPAVGRYRRARTAFTRAGAFDERAVTATAMLQALAYLGEYEEAFQVASDAMDYFAAAGEPLRVARLRANVANALHRLDRLQEASAAYQEALPVLQQHGAVNDAAIVMRNFAVTLMSLLEFEEADRLYRQSRTMFEEAEQRSLVLEVDLNRAYLLGRRGRVREALVAYRAVLEDLASLSDEDFSFEIGHGLLDQADFLLEVGLNTDAARAAAKALAAFQHLGLRLEESKANVFRGLALVRSGRLADGEKHLEQAVHMLRRSPNRTWRAISRMALAEPYLRRGEPTKALSHLRKAENWMKEGQSSERADDLRLRIADVLIQVGKDGEARASVAQPTHDDPSEFRRLAVLASIERRAGRLSESERIAREAIDRYDAVRSEWNSSSLRRSFRASREQALQEVIRCLRTPEERLAAVHRAKNQTLAELLAAPESFTADERVRRLRERLSVMMTRPEAEASGQLDLEEALEEARRAQDLGLLAAGLPIPGSFVLPEGVCGIEFFSDAGRMSVFVVRANQVEEVDLGDSAAMEAQARFLRLHLSRAHRNPDGGADRCLAWLSERLVSVLGIAQDAPQVVLCSDGPLSSVPLHALRVEGSPLFDRTDVSYAPSLAAWHAVQSRSRQPATGAAVLAGYDAQAPRIESEAREISGLIGADFVSINRGLSREEFARVVQQKGIVHFAAHGFVREDRPSLSGMRFGDLSLCAFDVMQWQLSAELVTLSGCATGVSALGENVDSEGLIEAVLLAGARSVFASLWQVDDAVTETLMTAFYRELLVTGDFSTAYRVAVRCVRERNDHPVHWAPFCFFGDTTKKVSAIGCKPVPS